MPTTLDATTNVELWEEATLVGRARAAWRVTRGSIDGIPAEWLAGMRGHDIVDPLVTGLADLAGLAGPDATREAAR